MKKELCLNMQVLLHLEMNVYTPAVTGKFNYIHILFDYMNS